MIRANTFRLPLNWTQPIRLISQPQPRCEAYGEFRASTHAAQLLSCSATQPLGTLLRRSLANFPQALPSNRPCKRP
ncbi:hypothetical protein IG631_10835 [Alternaria alternata]|nr:hypothetical protein IG631_10835 [Alternaria alternata]